MTKPEDLPPGAQRQSRCRRNKNKHPDSPKNSQTENSDLDTSPSSTPVQSELETTEEGDEFKAWVKSSLSQLCKAVLGDDKAKQVGVCTHLSKVEVDLYGSDKTPTVKGLKARVTDLEAKIQKSPAATGGAPAKDVSDLQREVDALRTTNEMLVGATSKLQSDNKSLQNQLFIQQDHSNYLNLYLGGVEALEASTCKAEAVQFFKTILKITTVSEKDFLKAHRKTNANEYTEEVRDGNNVMKLKVKAPGIMFV